MSFEDKLAVTKKKLDGVSRSFCLAKWLQVTLHLQNGFNHSCHHPDLHKIPLDELNEGANALHNTRFKKELRRQMKRGVRPKECDYCWRVEDTAKDQFSDRFVKSADWWAESRFDEVKNLPDDANINPSYLEVSFSHHCNFRCVYCAPNVSSAIWQNFKKHGPYVGRDSIADLEKMGRNPYPINAKNPYVDAFWQWFPRISHDLKVLRITGGEPLLTENTFRVLEYLHEQPQKEMKLFVNSNLCVPDRFLNRFIEKANRVAQAAAIGSLEIYTSVDTHGAQAEYIRTGMDYQKWLTNTERMLTETDFKIVVMVTFNALSVPRFIAFLQDVQQLNARYGLDKNGDKRLQLDVSHLNNPEYFSACILNQRWKDEALKIAEYVRSRPYSELSESGFYDYEILKITRAVAYLRTNQPGARALNFLRDRFYTFTEQYRERDGREFLQVFPEMQDFYELCQNAGKEPVRWARKNIWNRLFERITGSGNDLNQ